MKHHIKSGIRLLILASVFSAPLSAPAMAEPQRVGLHCQIPDGHHMIREVRPCPDGSGTEYEHWSALSYSTFGRHLDWEPMSYMSFPYPMAICENGFVVDRPDDAWDEEVIAARTALIQDPDYQTLLGHQTSHFIYARLLEMEGAEADAISWHYLNSSWEADQCGADTYEASVRAFLGVVEGQISAMSPQDEAFAVYHLLQSNMHRRIGQFETARQLYDSFVSNHAGLVDENMELAFALLDEAIAAQSAEQIPIEAPAAP